MSIIGTWLELPVRPLLLLLTAFYFATGAIIHLLSLTAQPAGGLETSRVLSALSSPL